MKHYLRILAIISIAFSIRVLQSCCSCGDNPIQFDFSSIIIKNLDNSGSYVTFTDANQMYSSAVAFEVSITGDMALVGNAMKDFSVASFTEANACDCSASYSPNQTIKDISITTLKQMSAETDSGMVVTSLFVTEVADGYLYEPLTNVYARLNQEIYSDDPTAKLKIFCKENILNDTACFAVTVTLSDNSKITAETAKILLTALK